MCYNTLQVIRMEIEKKFLLNCLPLNIEKFDKLEIEQGYISYDPEIRIRRVDNRFFFTKKSVDNLVRSEEEKEINEECYNLLLTCIQNNLLNKTRYIIPISAKYNAEVDIYHNDLEGLYILEIEFETKEEAENFVAPKWFGTEVTCDNTYKNSNLSKNNKIKKKN